MHLRLDPQWPLVWRSTDTLQCGVDSPRALVRDVDEADEQIIRLLTSGVQVSSLRYFGRTLGVTVERVNSLVRSLDPVLIKNKGIAPVTDEGRRTPLPVWVHPSSIDKGIVKSALELSGIHVLPEDQTPLSPRDGEKAGISVQPTLVVLSSNYAIRPQQYREWMRNDTPHVPIIFSDSSVTVGPLVVPGTTSCLFCYDMHRRDSDPAWPAIATQAITCTAPTLRGDLVALSAAILVSNIRDFVESRVDKGTIDWADSPVRILGRTATIDQSSGDVSYAAVSKHPLCDCGGWDEVR